MKEARSEEFGARSAHRRGDVEGLRALAVLGVLLFHVGGWGFRGGFVGVDVFLVISGYLITGNLLRARTAGTVMLGDFYARRVVRILPVLLVVLATTLIYATVALLPVEIRRVGESAAAAAASVSNIYLYATTGYFAAAGEAQPLLHSWSLGVEEQFYLAYPVLLLWLMRGHRSPRPVLLGIGVASFALGTVQAFHQPAAGFYLLPARAWELALGAWLAAGRVRWRSARWQGRASAGGVSLILLGLVALKPDLPFPAPFALLPCAGTALVLAFGDDTRTGALLGARPLRWIGTISYSVYLWHWPIVTFYRLRFGTTLTLAEATMLLAASLVVGALSFVLVERPAMRGWRTASPSRVIASAAAAIAIAVTAGLSTANAAEWLHPTRPQVSAIASFVDYERSHEGRAQFRRGRCFATDDAPQFDWVRCLARQRGRPTLLVMGDSYAAQYWRAIAERFPHANVLQATAAGCRPLVGAGGSPRCTELMRRVFADPITTGRVDAVVLAGRWLAKEDAALARTIAVVRGHGIAVTVIGPAVEYDGSFPLLLARGVARDGGRGVNRFRLAGAAREQAIGSIAREVGAGYHSITVRECPHEQCRLFAASGVPVHFDNAHVTLPAARYLMRDLAWPR